MSGGIRIFAGRALRLPGLFGLVLAVPAATLSAIFGDTRWLDVGGVLLFSLAFAALGQLLYLWGIGARARWHDRMLIANSPPGTVVAMADPHMRDKMMATLKKLADARDAGHTAAAHWAERELNRLMKQDPLTAERLMAWLESEEEAGARGEPPGRPGST